jgi:hypothetical protein
VVLTFNDDHIVVESGDVFRSTEQVPAEVFGDPVEVRVHLKNFRAALRGVNTSEARVFLHKPTKPILVVPNTHEENNHWHTVMTIRQVSGAV